MTALRRITFILLCVVIMLLFALSPPVGATDDYDLSVSNSFDTPEESFTIDGQTFTVDSITAVDPGEQISVSVTAPEDQRFDVDLYNTDKHVIDFERGEGSETVHFQTDGLDPGTYVLGLYSDSNYQIVQPVVINGYDITLEYAADIEPGEDVEITASIEPITDVEDPAAVEIAIWNDETRITDEMTAVDQSTYETTISIEEEGIFQVNVGLQTDETVDGNPVVIGIADGDSLTVEESANGSGSDDDDSNGDDSSDDSDDNDSDDNESDENDSDDNTDENGEGDNNETTPTDTPVESPTPTDTPTQNGGTNGNGETPTETIIDPTTPASTPATEEPPTPVEDQAGFGFLLSIGGLIAISTILVFRKKDL